MRLASNHFQTSFTIFEKKYVVLLCDTVLFHNFSRYQRVEWCMSSQPFLTIEMEIGFLMVTTWDIQHFRLTSAAFHAIIAILES